MPVTRALAPLGGWVGWIVANAAGYALGFAVWQSIFPSVRPALSASPGGILLVAGFGAVVGLSAGLAQAIVQRQGIARSASWALAVALGTAVGFTLAAKVSELLNGLLEPRLGLDLLSLTDAVLVLSFGAIVGLCIGAVRWLLLLARDIQVARWMPASAVGLLIGYPLAIGVLELLPELDQPLVGLVFGGCAGATTALLEWLIMSRQRASSKANADGREEPAR
jgi:hypothetical protein